jgi:hypothetical protein
MTLQPGTQIEHYEILTALGVGGMEFPATVQIIAQENTKADMPDTPPQTRTA